MVGRVKVESLVLEALRLTNLSRPPDRQLNVAADAPLFGPGSTLDSLGLVAMVIDLEEALRDEGVAVDLSDGRAMSEKRSPFRSVASLVDYVMTRQSDERS